MDCRRLSLRLGSPSPEDSMSKLRVHNFAISLDGYGAGPRQGLKDPLGVGGEELHGWYIGTRAFREINGKTGGTTGPDNDFAKRFGEGIGAYIMGRNMRSEEHTSELQSHSDLVCRLLLEKK